MDSNHTQIHTHTVRKYVMKGDAVIPGAGLHESRNWAIKETIVILHILRQPRKFWLTHDRSCSRHVWIRLPFHTCYILGHYAHRKAACKHLHCIEYRQTDPYSTHTYTHSITSALCADAVVIQPAGAPWQLRRRVKDGDNSKEMKACSDSATSHPHTLKHTLSLQLQ